MKAAIDVLENDFILHTAIGAGKFALATYTTINSLQEQTSQDLGSNITPAEKVNEIYVADDMHWDYVQRFMPDFIIANTLRLM